MFRILVVDDDKNTRRLLQAVLGNEGYQVFTAENGEDALTVMDREYIDLVVLDIMMRFGHKTLELYVLDSNPVAQHLYESVGFRVCGRHYSAEANRMEWRREFV